MDICGIYQIINLINGKVYIGSSVNIYVRWRAHKKALRHNRHDNPALQNAYNKYGEIAFSFSILEIVSDPKNLAEREQYWIDKFQANNNKFGYNLRKLATSNSGMSYNRGEKAGRAILTEVQVLEIRSRLLDGEHAHHFAHEYGVSPRTILCIKEGVSWKHLRPLGILTRNSGTRNNNGANNPRSKITPEDAREIIGLLNNGTPVQELAKRFDVPRQTIWKIKTGKHWTLRNLR